MIFISHGTARKEGRKEEGFKCFQQLGSYHNKIETRNWEEIPFSSERVQRGLSVAVEP